MKNDPLFYRFFGELPECFFVLVGRPATDASRYRFEALELKGTSVRIDGVYVPRRPDEREPVYFVEYQNDKSERTYSNLLLKVGFYLEKVNPRQDWHGVVIYPSRKVEQDNLHPYRWLLPSEQMTRIYLDELPEPPPGDIGFGVLRLIAGTSKEAIERAQALNSVVRASTQSAERKQKLIELIGTIVAYQLPELGRKEIEKMLKVNDARETKFYQEAFQDGRQEGRGEGVETVAQRMLANDFTVEQIATATGLTMDVIKRLKRKLRK